LVRSAQRRGVERLPFAFDTKFPASDHAAFLAEFELP
jgi:hypothetical protein